MEDTIVAIGTALGTGAISIIRLSGKDAISIVNKMFTTKDLSTVPSHTIHYGFIKDKETTIDEVMVSIFRAPKTYTKEDVVEINCHGGYASTSKILELCLRLGARQAEPGEFTKRAFLNGRIDLTQAEAVQDIIEATTDSARNISMNQLTGSLKELIENTRKEIMSLLANIEVNIDYPEYEDAENITIPLLKEKLVPIKEKLEKLVKESDNAKIVQHGIDIAIVGRPNVGKSSLLNLFLEEDKAIVTDIAGTTRDIVEGTTPYKGILLNFIDTAGIRESSDLVEQIGVQKSKEMIKKADLVILVLNSNEELTPEDEELLHLVKNKKHIVFINKNDLKQKLDVDKILDVHKVMGNTSSKEGIDSLKEEIDKMFLLEELQVQDATYLTNARQKALVLTTIDLIDNALESIEKDIPVDMIEIDIKKIWDTLGEIIGATYKDELLDELFSHFCLGK